MHTHMDEGEAIHIPVASFTLFHWSMVGGDRNVPLKVVKKKTAG